MVSSSINPIVDDSRGSRMMEWVKAVWRRKSLQALTFTTPLDAHVVGESDDHVGRPVPNFRLTILRGDGPDNSGSS